jgi:hypothetical protein
MKAITLWQPWATAITLGFKKIETRSWATSFRGPIAIHAAALNTRALAAASGEILDSLPYVRKVWNAQYPGWNDLPFGAIVGYADLTGCIEMTVGNCLRLSEHERAFGDYTPGRFAWCLEGIRVLDDPIPCRGAQQLWNVPAHMVTTMIENGRLLR